MVGWWWGGDGSGWKCGAVVAGCMRCGRTCSVVIAECIKDGKISYVWDCG